MGVRSWVERHDYILQEVRDAWAWLRRNESYKKAYLEFTHLKKTPFKKTLLSSDVLTDEEKDIRTKWGFFPLDDPKSEMPSMHFIVDVGRLFGQNPYRPDVRIKDFDSQLIYSKNKKMEKDLPSKIVIEVDPRRSISYSIFQIAAYLKEIQQTFGVKTPKEDKSLELGALYKIHILKALGFSDKAIRKEKLRAGTADSESNRKHISRLLLQYKRIRPLR